MNPIATAFSGQSGFSSGRRAGSASALKMFWLLAGMCVFCSVSAQRVSLSGSVLNEHGDELSGACLIALDPETSEVIAATASDADGRYVLPSVPLPFMLNVTYIGYASLNIPVGGEADVDAIRMIRMQAAATQIGEVVVTADAPRIEREVGKFVMRNIAASPFAKGSSTYNFLRFMPMVDVRPEGGISILGKTDASIRIDGRIVGSNQMAEQMLKGIPASEIARIEIIPVTGSSYAAESRSGVINVVLKKRPDDGVRFIATVEDRQGYYNSPNGVLFMNYAGKRLDLTAGVTASYNQLRQESEQAYDYFQTGLATRSEFRESTRPLYVGGYVNLDYRIADRHRLGAQITLSGTDYRHNSSSVSTYGKIGSGLVDSIYTANVRTKSPTANLNWKGNLNYVFSTDDSGSHLSVDLDFIDNANERNIYSLYRRESGASSVVTDDFLQQPETDTRVYGGRVEYVHCFNPDNTLRIGMSAYRGKVDNDFFYGTRSGERYVSDPGRSNHFVYKDYNLAGYVSFQRVWSEKVETEIGARVEKYHARGIQRTTSETVERDEFDVFPSLSLLYMPSDDHELSLDFSSSIARPYYGQLNPFITYTSPSTYVQNNPYLRSSKGYELMFTYTLLDDYMLTVNYLYDDDLWTEFILPVGEMTRKYMDNYGDSHALDVSLLVSKSLFRSHWNLSAEATMGYVRTRGAVSGQRIDIDDISCGVTVKSNLALSKKRSWYLDLKYQYSSKSRAAAFEIGSTHEMELYLMKQFRRASLSVGVYNVLMPTVTFGNTFPDYRFSIANKRYVTGVVTFSYIFGNQRARRVEKRQNENIEKRMQ